MKYIWIPLLFFSSIGFGGEVSSGGGHAIVCRNANGKILKSQVLDLFEAEFRGQILRKPVGNLELEFLRYSKEIFRLTGQGPAKDSDILSRLHKDLQKLYYFLPPGVRLKVVQDIGKTVPKPKDCEFEQVAVYRDDQNRIDINSEIWNSLSSLDQVALMAHENIYQEYRTSGDHTSENSRLLVGRLFAESPLQSALAGLPQELSLCSAGFLGGLETQSQFYLFNPTPTTTVIQFLQLFGKKTYSQARLELPLKIDIAKLVSDSGPSGPLLRVNHQEANLNNVFDLENEIFPGRKVVIRYRHDEPFSIATLDSEGQLDKLAPVSLCQKTTLNTLQGGNL